MQRAALAARGLTDARSAHPSARAATPVTPGLTVTRIVAVPGWHSQRLRNIASFNHLRHWSGLCMARCAQVGIAGFRRSGNTGKG
jgi:hypothetical protein